MKKNSAINPKIMVVDDDELIQAFYKEYFTELGHETVTCGDGTSALKIARSFDPDIMIADLKMPGMNGLELMSKINGQSPEIEIIIISGKGTMVDAIKSFRDGAVDFLPKPVDPGDLMAAFNRAVKKILLKRAEKASPQEIRAILHTLIMTYEEEKIRLFETMHEKLNAVIYPQIDQLTSISDSRDICEGLLFVKELLTETFFPHYSPRLAINAGLSPVEIKICDLITQWKYPQEISELLNLSIYTVYDHRKRIRKKLALPKKESLDKYLRSRKTKGI